MLTVTRWFIKAGMLYLGTGIFLLFLDSIPVFQIEINLLPIYWHMIAIGWITQVIIGVSIWMFPRKNRDRKKTEPVLAWAVFWLLNIGLILRFLAEPFLDAAARTSLTDVIILLSVLMQLGAAILYTAEIWPRIQPKKTLKPSR